jgi:thiamine-monophosphate kinase
MKHEEDLIRWLRDNIPPLPDMQIGIGDDAAVLNVPDDSQLVVSTDSLVEDVHFLLDRVAPIILGRKAMRVNLSDLAAMAARPLFSLLSLTVPKKCRSQLFLEGILEGVIKEALHWEAPLIGGNISRGEKFQITITIGGTVARGTAILRSGCNPGDSIYVLGRIGHSGAGLRFLSQCTPVTPLPREEEAILRWVDNSWDALCIRSHLLPEPQLEGARWLSSRRLATSMIDTSDGLARDLLRLCQASQVDLVIHPKGLESLRLQADDRIDTLDILEGGEDYALLFSCPTGKEEDLSHFPKDIGTPIWIAKARASTGNLLVVKSSSGVEEKYAPRGFDHFQ